MSTYTFDMDTFRWAEAHIGACPERSRRSGSRIGVYLANKNLVIGGVTQTNPLGANERTNVRGKRNYELSNHLGNVLVVISDKRQGVCSQSGLTNYQAEIVSATVPIAIGIAFGSAMPGREYTMTEYRYGFNGMEKDFEVFENCIAYEARIFDSRIGRFFSSDPKEMEYPWQSTYVYFKNTPVSVIDYFGEGEEEPDKSNSNDESVQNSLKENINEAKNILNNEKPKYDWSHLTKWGKIRFLSHPFKYWKKGGIDKMVNDYQENTNGKIGYFPPLIRHSPKNDEKNKKRKEPKSYSFSINFEIPKISFSLYWTVPDHDLEFDNVPDGTIIIPFFQLPIISGLFTPNNKGYQAVITLMNKFNIKAPVLVIGFYIKTVNTNIKLNLHSDDSLIDIKTKHGKWEFLPINFYEWFINLFR